MAPKGLRRGIFITFEGPEGCGKSTQSKLLYNYLRARSYDCIHTREPGGTEAGERIRQILLHSKKIHITDYTELFLFEANRSQIVEEVIRPNLAKKRIVICDRFNDATRAYQGYGGRIPLKKIEMLNTIATGGLKPDLTILLDVDTPTGLRRAKVKGIDRMEAKDIIYHRRVRAGYLKLAKKDPGRIKVIRITNSIANVQQDVRTEVELVIQRYKRPG
ncbi:MAG: dTMP kinase [Candidatus Omnitrophica bacterium]|nr:dTMP kinase [Candidatus Omnitrophota bacterium]